MKWLSKDECVFINTEITKSSSIFNDDRLLSALSNQHQSYDLDEQRIASTYRSLILNHPFLDGNKRTAFMYVVIIANINHIKLNASEDDLIELTLSIAKNGSISVNSIANKLFKLSLDEAYDDFLAEFISTYNISKQDAKKIIQWWKDVEKYYVVDLTDIDNLANIDDWFIAMYDMLKELKEDNNEELKDLLKQGTKLYNKYAISQFNETFELNEDYVNINNQQKLDSTAIDYINGKVLRSSGIDYYYVMSTYMGIEAERSKQLSLDYLPQIDERGTFVKSLPYKFNYGRDTITTIYELLYFLKGTKAQKMRKNSGLQLMPGTFIATRSLLLKELAENSDKINEFAEEKVHQFYLREGQYSDSWYDVASVDWLKQHWKKIEFIIPEDTVFNNIYSDYIKEQNCVRVSANRWGETAKLYCDIEGDNALDPAPSKLQNFKHRDMLKREYESGFSQNNPNVFVVTPYIVGLIEKYPEYFWIGHNSMNEQLDFDSFINLKLDKITEKMYNINEVNDVSDELFYKLREDENTNVAMAVMSDSDEKQEEPYIGPFWYDTNKEEVFGNVMTLASDKPFYDMKGKKAKTGNALHKNIWKKEEKRGKDKRFTGDYKHVPRGRVFEFEDDGFKVYVGNWIEEHPEAKEEIIDVFQLPRDKTEFIKDSHWDLGHGWSEELYLG